MSRLFYSISTWKDQTCKALNSKWVVAKSIALKTLYRNFKIV